MKPIDRLLWRDEFDFANRDDVATAMAVSGSNVIVAGQAEVTGGIAIFVRAYDANSGTVQWTDQFPSLPGAFPRPVYLKSQGGVVYLAGQVDDRVLTNGGSDIIIRAYNAENGNLLWQDYVDNGRSDTAEDMVATPHAIVVVGYSNPDWIVRAYDPWCGRVLWDEQIGRPSYETFAWRVDGDEAGVIVQGTQHPTSDIFNNVTLVRSYDPRTGALLWESTQENISVMALRVADGYFYLAGRQANPNSVSYLAAFKRANGQEVWQQTGVTGWIPNIDVKAKVLVAVVGARGAALLIRGLNSKTGALLWETSTTPGQDLRDGAESMILSHSALYLCGIRIEDFVSSELKLWVYDTSNGALLLDESPEGQHSYPGGADIDGVGLTGKRLFMTGRISAIDNPSNQNLLVRTERIKLPK